MKELHFTEEHTAMDKKKWNKPVMEKLDVAVHTQNNIQAGDDGNGNNTGS